MEVSTQPSDCDPFRKERANAFLDDQKHVITHFCRKYRIAYNPCPTTFWLWAAGIVLRLPEASTEDREEARNRLTRNRAYPTPEGVMTATHGLIVFDPKLCLPR